METARAELYFSHPSEKKKLHLGCGPRLLEGWINADVAPAMPRVLAMDASQRFPFSGDSFDFIFSEHMIEHLPCDAGLVMLSESFRVLKPAAWIRIATPDLQFLIGLYVAPRQPLHASYIKWAANTFMPSREPTAALVVNNFMRDWQHAFIYDRPTLRNALTEVGFVAIREPELGESEVPELQGLEHVHRLPPGFLALESMVFEAQKPR